MNRQLIIQKIIDLTKAKSYLEIGVEQGFTFLTIKAKKKVAVDPCFSITFARKLKWIIKNFCNISARYYEVTSNYYFKNICSPRSLEIVFVDGLHTYDQALYDIENSLINIKNGGVVILHDCNPPHKNAAMPAKSHKQAAMQKLPGWTNEWCGDVWKAICHLRSFRNDLNIFVLDCDYGIGIITKGVSENNLYLNRAEIDNLTFDDLKANRKKFLNLKSVEFLEIFLKNL